MKGPLGLKYMPCDAKGSDSFGCNGGPLRYTAEQRQFHTTMDIEHRAVSLTLRLRISNAHSNGPYVLAQAKEWQ